jgi:hypothetical protein
VGYLELRIWDGKGRWVRPLAGQASLHLVSRPIPTSLIHLKNMFRACSGLDLGDTLMTVLIRALHSSKSILPLSNHLFHMPGLDV